MVVPGASERGVCAGVGLWRVTPEIGSGSGWKAGALRAFVTRPCVVCRAGERDGCLPAGSSRAAGTEEARDVPRCDGRDLTEPVLVHRTPRLYE